MNGAGQNRDSAASYMQDSIGSQNARNQGKSRFQRRDHNFLTKKFINFTFQI